jgi:putative GTP pyrophosphokinase
MDVQQWERLKQEIVRFMMTYKFAVEELRTKIEILRQEFHYIHDHNPIEQITCRVKSPESILQKARRKGVPLSLPAIRENIRDIAGVRIICAFVSDIYRVSEMLQKQSDLHIAECKDYIQNPKPNGYRSLHLIVQLPVFMSDHTEKVWAEIQIRTIAMDFWASLEHKLNYKYNYQIPEPLLNELRAAAESIAALDAKMEKINRQANHFKATLQTDDALQELWLNNQRYHLPKEFLSMLLNLDNSRE